MVFDVRGSRNGVNELAEVIEATGRIELLRFLQFFGDGDRVDHRTPFEEPHHRSENATIRFTVKHPVLDHLNDTRHRVLVDQHAPENSGFRLQGERRGAIKYVVREVRRSFHELSARRAN